MQAILGPSVIEHGVNPETAIVGFGNGGMAVLGPARGPSKDVDPIARFFVILGKMINIRRLISPKEPGDVCDRKSVDYPIHYFGAVQAATLATHFGDEFDVVWKPLTERLKTDVIDPLARQTEDLDQRIRRFVAKETHTVLAIDPTASVEKRMEGLEWYLQNKGYTVEKDTKHGFYEFIKRSFTDTNGKRIDLPTSTNPSFPDAWITPEQVITERYGGSRREWSVLF